MKKLQFLKAGDDMKTITSANYLDRIMELNGTPDIKIIIGCYKNKQGEISAAVHVPTY